MLSIIACLLILARSCRYFVIFIGNLEELLYVYALWENKYWHSFLLCVSILSSNIVSLIVVTLMASSFSVITLSSVKLKFHIYLMIVFSRVRFIGEIIIYIIISYIYCHTRICASIVLIRFIYCIEKSGFSSLKIFPVIVVVFISLFKNNRFYY